MDRDRPARDVWCVQRKPVDILGKLAFRLDFQLRGWDIFIHHALYHSETEADREWRALTNDLNSMLDGPFRAKYRIAHDLRGGF